MRIWHIAAAVALAVAAWTAYWLHAASRVEALAVAWAEAERARGSQVSWQGLGVGGYPFRLEATVEAPALALARLPERPFWQAERLTAILQPWNFRRILVDLSGRHEAGYLVEGSVERVIAVLQHARGGVQFDDLGRLSLLSLEADGIEAERPERGETLRLGHLELHARPSRLAEGIADLALQARAVVLPAPGDPVVGRELERLSADLSVTGVLPPSAVDLPAALLQWRDSGGTLEVRHATADFDRIRLDANGTLALDAETRPVGSLTVRLDGHRRLLERLAGAGRIDPGQVGMMTAALDLLAVANGGVLKAPARLQDGRLYVGTANAEIPVARLRPLLAGGARNPAPASPGRRQ